MQMNFLFFSIGCCCKPHYNVDFLSCRTTSLRSKFPHSDLYTNPGYVLSPVITQRDAAGDASCSVKVSIEISESQQPVTFTCDGRDSNPQPSLTVH